MLFNMWGRRLKLRPGRARGMDALGILRGASGRIAEAVRGMAGTDLAGGDYGRGAGGDISRKIDIVAEEAVLGHLRGAGFGCVVLGEECGRVEIPGGPGGYVVMDAIDGSANAVRGVPFFCSSLAYAEGGRLSSVTAGVVTDLSTGASCWATRGGGAFYEGEPARVSGGDRPYRIAGVNTSGADGRTVERLLPVFERCHTRHFGANALEMSMLARGLVDVLVDLRGKIRVQDIAAGYLLVSEAGGLLLDGGGGPLDADLDYSTRISYVAASSRAALDAAAPGIV